MKNKTSKQIALVPYFQHKMNKFKAHGAHSIQPQAYSLNQTQVHATSTKGQGFHPLWDGYFTSYMEETQKSINEFIKFEEYQTFQFGGNDLTRFIFDLADYLTGTQGIFKKLVLGMKK